ncbi:tetrapyrrole methylase [Bacillus sp. TS-2]|nr:tetrapyrrole methylase [Bacillus sp. TS-2]
MSILKEQKSFSQNDIGQLYLVPTPIGNLDDITFRAIKILKEVDGIACEDTRQTKKLCHYFEIDTPLFSYHEHNKEKAGTQIVEKLKQGQKIAIVSDAGMPAISDPGNDLVQLALDEEEISVIAIPGANAALTSLIASGLSTNRFQFIGFLPRHKKTRQQLLEQIKQNEETLIFYEAPHRLKETLQSLRNELGNRRITICRELTKKFEEYQRGTLEEACTWVESGMIKGEFCLVVEGATEVEEEADQWWFGLTIHQHVDHYIQLGMMKKEAIKQVAVDRSLQKREVYQIYHQ